MAQYCPHVTTCPFYQSWTEKTKDKRVDVIFNGERGGRAYYDCLALAVLSDFETGTPMTDELKNKLSDPKQREFKCSHITLLNRLIGDNI
ncbi:hypothetical protein FJZ20_02530 [Candidatus Pacearchaeota archaeon]|nr:hypothetical protein [Candidatus Pacearchaeota archaeon]